MEECYMKCIRNKIIIATLTIMSVCSFESVQSASGISGVVGSIFKGLAIGMPIGAVGGTIAAWRPELAQGRKQGLSWLINFIKKEGSIYQYLKRIERQNKADVSETHRDWARQDAYKSVRNMPLENTDCVNTDFINPEIQGQAGMIAHTQQYRAQSLADKRVARDVARQTDSESVWLASMRRNDAMHNNAPEVEKNYAAWADVNKSENAYQLPAIYSAGASVAKNKGWSSRAFGSITKQFNGCVSYMRKSPERVLAAVGLVAATYYVGKKLYQWWWNPLGKKPVAVSKSVIPTVNKEKVSANNIHVKAYTVSRERSAQFVKKNNSLTKQAPLRPLSPYCRFAGGKRMQQPVIGTKKVESTTTYRIPTVIKSNTKKRDASRSIDASRAKYSINRYGKVKGVFGAEAA